MPLKQIASETRKRLETKHFITQSIQAHNQLGTPGGGEEFSKGPNFLNYVQHIFSGVANNFL